MATLPDEYWIGCENLFRPPEDTIHAPLEWFPVRSQVRVTYQPIFWGSTSFPKEKLMSTDTARTFRRSPISDTRRTPRVY